MPPRDWKLRIVDIVNAINHIDEYVFGMEFEDFAEDSKTLDAVIRNFTIIGEASGHIPAEIIEEWDEVPWRDMRDIRNIVVHAYFGIMPKVLWDTIKNDLPPLKPMLKKIQESF